MSSPSAPGSIRLRGVRQNNLKGFDLDLPLRRLIVVTGLSGSGKSSLAFETLYAEGQRRYVETFSPYARQFFERMDKPRVDAVEGIPPAIAIEQRNAVRTTRSTVGTMTEICDYMKALWPHVATLYCAGCGRPVRREDPAEVWRASLDHWKEQEVLIVFEVPLSPGMALAESLGWIRKQGYQRLLIDDAIVRLEEAEATLARVEGVQSLHLVQDKIRLSPPHRARFVEACEQAFHFGRGTLTVQRWPCAAQERRRFSKAMRCADCGKEHREPSPALFSFNHPIGACPACKGFGRVITIDYKLAVPDHSKTLKEGVVRPWLSGHGAESQRDLMKFCRRLGIPVDVPLQELPPDTRRWVIEGDPDYGKDAEHQWPKAWYGVKGYFRWLESKSYKMHYRVFLARYRAYETCPQCQGNRFQPETLFYRLPVEAEARTPSSPGLTLAEFYRLTVRESLGLVRGFSTGPRGAEKWPEALRTVWHEVASRLGYLEEVGLGYLTLDRPTKTLSGGETERVNLTTCLGARLVNTLFVLDEPSVGLHTRDTARLVRILERLRDEGNTVVVVEHEPDVMRAADHLLDLGPGRGEAGGEIVFQGTFAEILRAKESLTGDYLAGRAKIGGGRHRKVEASTPRLSVRVGHRHNLHGLHVRVPLGRLVCITGVSGSGKTTLVKEVLLPLLRAKLATESPGESDGESAETDGDAASGASVGEAGQLEGWESLHGVALVDQSALARTPRSNPGGYVGAWDEIRKLFAASDDAIRDELEMGAFSFNSALGQCERCRGAGFEKVEMQFLSDLYIRCPACDGKRFRPHVLKARLRPPGGGSGWNAADMLEATIDDAVAFLERFQGVRAALNAVKHLRFLQSVGLGYLRVGQPLNTLSGGESQRLKLVGHLAEAVTGVGHNRGEGAFKPMLFLLDEPTTGLHFDDVRLLIGALQQLVEAGHSLVVVEHNLGMIRAADWIIDLGPEAGDGGGTLVVEGPPESVEQCETGHTGRALKADRAATGLVPAVRDTPDRAAAREGTGPLKVRGAREHNLKNIDLDLPRNQFVVVTGISGSGKSTLAFDLIFNEGQRRFLDCMSAYARQYVEQMARPDVDLISGLPPTVSIEQRNSQGGAKSTVATVTEVYHFIRLLFARLGVVHCPKCGIAVGSQTKDEIVERLRGEIRKRGTLKLLAPLVRHRKGFHTEVGRWAAHKGFQGLRVDGLLASSSTPLRLDRFVEHTIEVITGECSARGTSGRNAAAARALVEQTLELGGGTLLALDGRGKTTIHSTERTCGSCSSSFEALDPKHFSYHSPQGWCPRCRGFGELFYLPDTDRGARADAIEESWFHWQEGKREVCPDCHGARLNEVARHVRLDLGSGLLSGKRLERNLSAGDMAALSVESAAALFQSLRLKGRAGEIARDIIPEVRERLRFMMEVGLGYLQLGRGATTLSGGEAQRIRLAAQLGSNLSGVMYVLDEPTIGLHARDNEQLLDAFGKLRGRGNSLLVVEHDEETMRRADHVIDLGPGAGVEGGTVVAQGTLADLERSPQSVTGRCLREKRSFPARGSRRPVGPDKSKPERRADRLRESPAPYRVLSESAHPAHSITKPAGWLALRGAGKNNLRGEDVFIPLGRLVLVTGVSGSGKSTLIKECLLPALQAALAGKKRVLEGIRLSGQETIKAVYEVDQSPIGRTPRSTPATYVGFFDDIRALFAKAPEAKVRGYGPGRFSFNSAAGRCAACEGAGLIKLEMNFLPSAFVRCESCQGLRFSRETLDVKWMGRSIAEVLDLSVAEAVDYFEAHARIRRPLEALLDTGLGYLRLGQTSPTLSGGEAQRVKLVTHLLSGLKGPESAGRDGSGNLFILEEPTIGLHMLDVKKLVEVLQRLVDGGHTVVVIEHNLDLIAEADWVIDLGPEGGEGGGRVVACGTPETVSRSIRSHTGLHLKKFFAAHRERSGA